MVANAVFLTLIFNCMLAVTAVANGVQAWSVLDDLTNHVDIVLAEVVLPCLSGIGLLCKIMNHKTCKNIPVISEYCSKTLYKCLNISLFLCMLFLSIDTFNCYTW